jgi:hypothetical protein|tara:strand:- start:644 stop:973 length:330 start_codon:yes stop_codon:yes gene_type:complete
MSAFDKQVGGDHYRDMAISPVKFIEFNGLGYCVGNIIKYVCRWRKSSGSGIEDLEKAKHYIDLLIELNTSRDEEDDLGEIEVIEIFEREAEAPRRRTLPEGWVTDDGGL